MHSLYIFTIPTLLAGVAFAQNCVMTVPANPTSAEGMATPFVVQGCDQTQLALASFVECAIYDGMSNITIYHPLVVNNGSVAGVDYIPPIPITVPSGSTVGCWFGSNACSLTLTGPGASQCVNGLDGQVFGQFAYCNGDVFMKTLEAAVSAGTITPPAPGSALGGQCPTIRDFKMVDQDQSDNVITTYLLTGNNTLAQNTPANAAANPNATELTNGSDNALVDVFLDAALGCKPWKVNSPTSPTGMTAALALNELVANFNPPIDASPAHVPLNDPMVLQGGNFNLQKVNLYRAGVGQPAAQTEADADPLTYCKNFAVAGIWIQENQANFAGKTSPMPGVAVDLFTFMANRYSASLSQGMLGCLGLLNITNPVTLTTNSAGVVTAASINITPLAAIATANGLNVSAVDDFTAAAATATTLSSQNSVVAASSRLSSQTSATVANASAVTTLSLTSSLSGVTLPTVVASTTGSSVVLAVSGSALTVPASASSPTSSTSTTTTPTTLLTVASNAATCSFTVTAAPSTTTKTVTVTTSASFTRDQRGLLWDGSQWHVPAIFIGLEWVEFAGPAPTIII